MTHFKVVTKDRHSVMAGGTYREHYKAGERKVAKSGTMGFLVFDDYNDAERFHHWYQDENRYGGPCIIIEVRGIGESSKPEFVSSNTDSVGLDIYYRAHHKAKRAMSTVSVERQREYLSLVDRRILTNLPPTGTVCFNEIEVLT